MKIHVKKITLLPLLVMAGVAFILMNGNATDNIAVNENDQGAVSSMFNTQEQMPDLKFKDENDETISMRSLKGKVVFVNLWATWCPPCIHEMPSINELRQTFKDNEDLVFLMVDVDGNIKRSKRFMEKRKFDLPVHVPASEIPRDLFSGSIPTTFIVDKKGEIVIHKVGGANYMSKGVVDLMNELLEEAG